MRKWLWLGLGMLLLGLSATPALAQKSTPVPTPTPEPVKPTAQPTPTEAIPPTNTPPPPATATDLPPPPTDTSLPTDTSPPPVPTATDSPSPVSTVSAVPPSPTAAITAGPVATGRATLTPTVVTVEGTSAAASATLPPTATPSDLPTDTPSPGGVNVSTVEPEPSLAPRASVPPVTGSEKPASGWWPIGGLVAVTAFVAVALGVGLYLGRRASADPASVSAPDAERAETDQAQVLVLELGQVKAQLIQATSDQQHAVVAEESLVEPLSQREQEVLELVAQGLTNREVAQKLFITTNTVKVHTRNIYGKLGVGSRTQAIAKARTLGILSDA